MNTFHSSPLARASVAAAVLCLSVSAVPEVRAQSSVAPVVAWPVFGYTPVRDSAPGSAAGISAANVMSLHRQWVTSLGDIADSTPILLPHVRLPNGKTRALLFQTTKYGTTNAVDAQNGAIVWRFRTKGPAIWRITPPGPKITTSTPAADPSGRYIYAPGTDGFVHKLLAASGAEVRGHGFPLRITLMPDIEKDASALNLANGYLYAATSGYIGDQGPYDGHVVTLRLRDGATHVFNTLCSTIHHLLLDRSYDPHSAYSCPQAESGIWARAGVVVDPDPAMGGRIYVTTGNGRFDANQGGSDYGDSVLALSKDGARLLDSYTPEDYAALESGDTDLGSTAPVMLPREPHSRTPLMAIQGGKDEIIRLLNRQHLGGVGGEMQQITVPGAVLFSAPAVWRDPGTGTWIYLGDNSNVTALRLRTDARGTSRLSIAWVSHVTGTSPVVAGGIVFVAGDGVLSALDAHTGRTLWQSTSPSAGGTIGDIHWESPIVIGGWVYISDESGHLTAYAVSGAQR